MSSTETVPTHGGALGAVERLAHKSRDASVDEFGVFASTTEALTLTILTELVRRASLQTELPSSVGGIVDGVYAAERDHWLFISKLYQPSTTKFWIPDGFFGGAGDAVDLTAVGQAVAAGEHLFVNTYLVGVTTCAAAGRTELARYCAELAAVEAEHRVLGQTLAGANPPNDLGFGVFEFDRISQIEEALVGAGFGLGEQGGSAGRFYDLAQEPIAPRVPINSNEPR